MLVQDGGGGYSGTTNWYGYDIESMWTAVENQSTDQYTAHLSGWRKASELLSNHVSRMQMYRDNLAAAWSPDKNAAAAAYVQRLDDLIANVQDTYNVSVANYTTYVAVMTAVISARADLKEIRDEHIANQAAEKEFQDKKDTWGGIPGFSLVVKDPGTAAKTEVLSNRARSVMYQASSALAEAQATLQQPKPYSTKAAFLEDATDVTYGSSGSPPVIPPIVPVTSMEGAGSSTTAASTAPANRLGEETGSGPVLSSSSTATAPTPAVVPGTTIPTTTPPPSAPSTVSPVLPVVPQSPSPVRTIAPMTPVIGATPKSVGGNAGLTNRPAMPPGGIIGGTPGNTRPATSGPISRINPVGGVIGTGPGTGQPIASPSARGGASSRPSVGAIGQPGPHSILPAQSRRRDDEAPTEKRWNPDNPWETDEGVAPVVIPPQQISRVDPGPTIGYDR